MRRIGMMQDFCAARLHTECNASIIEAALGFK